MAMIAIAAGIINGPRAVRRGPNLIKLGCEMSERDWLALRLTEPELRTLTNEFCQWRLRTKNVGIQRTTSVNAE